MSKTQNKIISKLIELAKTSTLNRKHASAICCGRKIINSSVNSPRTKFNKHISVCGHSEANCIHAFVNQRRQYVSMPSSIDGGSMYNLHRGRKMKKYTLYVVRRFTNIEEFGLMAPSAPCMHCTQIIRYYGFQKIVYIDETHNIKVVKMKDYTTNYMSSGNKRMIKNLCNNKLNIKEKIIN